MTTGTLACDGSGEAVMVSGTSFFSTSVMSMPASERVCSNSDGG
jgi:hypothetical protein